MGSGYAALLGSHGAAAVLGLFGAALCWFVPRLIARVPEPTQTSAPDYDGPTFTSLSADPSLLHTSLRWGGGAGVVLGESLGWRGGWFIALVPVMVALGVIDHRTRLLPKSLVAPLYAAAVGLIGIQTATGVGDGSELLRAAWGWAIMGGFFALTWLISPRLMGYGDVRLAGVLGLLLGFLGWSALLVGLYAGFVVFTAQIVVAALVRRDRSLLRRRTPYGPAMLVGALIGVGAGPAIVGWLIG